MKAVTKCLVSAPFTRGGSLAAPSIRRQLSVSTTLNSKNVEFGLLFDVDGVLLRGSKLLPQTRECMKLITDEFGKFKVPTVFVTNAGNDLRSSKAKKLSNLFDLPVASEQIVMSHSPLRMFTSFHDKRCLISGQGPIVRIARQLGFRNVITMENVKRFYPHLDMVDLRRRTFASSAPLSRYFPSIEAIILFGESTRWETSLQLLIDVLMCDGKLNNEKATQTFPSTHLPILACNTDMVWMAEAHMPRFGHGSFVYCLEQLYQKLSGHQLKYSAIVGKPSEYTYLYAESKINEQARQIGIPHSIKRLYAIGDNIDTDIAGANLYNRYLQRPNPSVFAACQPDSKNFWSSATSMHSILVSTGVSRTEMLHTSAIQPTVDYGHRDIVLDATLKKPNYIVNNAFDAVKLAFEMESKLH